MNRSFFAITAALLGLILAAPPAIAQGTLPPGVLKLHSRGTGDKSGYFFGNSVALSDTWVVVGEPHNSDIAASTGAAYVYAASTGRFVRRLTPVPALPALANFGQSVAISGPLALIGADGESNSRGAAYVFDLRTGRQLARLTAVDGADSDRFGVSVALAGDLALIGAEDDDASRGAAYLFHARTGAQLGKLMASNGANGHRFGASVALSGAFALVGATQSQNGGKGAAYTYDVSGAFLPGAVFPQLAILTAADGAVTDEFGVAVSLSGHRALIGAQNHGGIFFRGAAYLFDARVTGSTPLRKFVPDDAADGDAFGNAVALNGNLAVVCARGRKTVHLYDTTTGGEINRLTRPDKSDTTHFPSSLAVSGNRLVVGAREDDDLGFQAGAAYLFGPVSVPMPLTAVAKVGDFAPGTVETNFTGFTAAYLNDEAEVGLAASVTGRGRGVWSDYAGPLRPDLRVGEEVDAGIFIATIGEIIPEQGDRLLIQTTLRGPGFNRTNNLAWVWQDGGNLFDALRIGVAYDKVNGSAALLTLPEVVQRVGSGHVLAAYTLARSTTTGTTAANDSGVTYRNASGSVDGAVVSDTRHREGSAAPTVTVGDTYGQFFGQVSSATPTGYFTFPAYYFDTSPADPLPDVVRQGVFYDRFTTDNPGVLAIQGGAAPLPGAPTPTYRTFLGVAMGGRGYNTIRALVTGTGITRANDEGLFDDFEQPPGIVYLREGQALDAVNAPGVVVGGFLGYWAVEDEFQIITLVKLRGPGVTRANDCALLFCSSDDTKPRQILLREGDLAGADDASRIGTIQRVDVDNVNGHYHILASLTGSKARNQALFQGNALLGDDDALRGQRLPAMVLRKGQGYQQPSGETNTIKALTMPVATDRTGAGAKGHGQAINSAGEVAVTLEFASRVREVWKGKP
jgi:hypothetical protein